MEKSVNSPTPQATLPALTALDHLRRAFACIRSARASLVHAAFEPPFPAATPLHAAFLQTHALYHADMLKDTLKATESLAEWVKLQDRLACTPDSPQPGES